MVLKDDHGHVPYKIEPSFTHSSSYTMREPEYDDPLAPRFDRFIDGFRRDPNSTFSAAAHLEDPTRQLPLHHGPYYDLHLATLENAHIGLARRLKGRHLQMIAIGGSIGTVENAQLTPTRANIGLRNRAVCRVRQIVEQRRPGLTARGLFDSWSDAVLYMSGSGRACCDLPSGRILFILGNTLSGPLLGIRHGLEVCTT